MYPKGAFHADVDAELLRLANLVREHKGNGPIATLTPEVRLREDLGFDSLDLAELTVRLEERFGVDVFGEGVVRQVGEISDRLKRHVAGQR
jgi:acyl carrier protein